MTHSRPRRRAALAAGALALAAGASAASAPAALAATPHPEHLLLQAAGSTTSSGLPKGAIKHVWTIILENKSYDATFTGLNKNSYLWSVLPKQGALLTQYYGTGHFSQDNYESLVSGQAPEQDTQSDCDVAATNFSDNAHVVTSGGSLDNNPNYGQAVSLAGANAADGKNGCVYPSGVPTLFNQLDLAGKTWKGYMQDLHNQPGREDAPCGYPGTATNAADSTTVNTANPLTGPTQINNPKAYPGVASFGGVQAAGKDAAGNPGAKEDGYVAKHNPFPWFHSLLDGTTTPADGGADCDSSHVVNLDDPQTGLVHDLQLPSAQVPAFTWITPNNCSDAHDALCKGNNLSGAFDAQGNPKYHAAGDPTTYVDPRSYAPVNYTGGLYASDLFLRWYVPLIEQSAAFADGGLIDITFDEANPPFVNSSFNNANDPQFAPGKVTPGISKPANAQTYLQSDAAGQNLYGTDTPTEPAGPNSPLGYDSSGKPFPGPGDSGFIDRAPAGARTDSGATGSAGATFISDNSIRATDAGRTVSAGGQLLGYVGQVSDTGPLFPTTNTGSVTSGSFQLVDASGTPVVLQAAVSGIQLGAQSADPKDKSYDPLYDATDLTPGGGDTGSVLISPFITPGTVSATYYNHYSWLRTVEDLFDVGSAPSDEPAAAGTVAAGLDGLGHLGYAAQPGLRPFGPDVFTNPAGSTPTAGLPEAPLAALLPLSALAAGGVVLVRRRRRGARADAGAVLPA